MTLEDITQTRKLVLCSRSMPGPRIVFLGTGGALNPERYQPTILVDAGATRLLLDTGGGLGVVRRLLEAKIDPSSVNHIFLSHRHLDHVGGLEPLLLTMSYRAFRADRPLAPVALYALAGSAQAIRATHAAADASAERRFGDRLTWVTPTAGSRVALDTSAGLTLTPVDHLPPGGAAAGCVVDVAGARIAYSGDTRPYDAFADAARGVDLLIHEVGGLDSRATLIHQVGHSTAGDAGRVAERAGARALALFHLPAAEWAAPADLLAEARAHASGVEVFLTEDGMVWGA
jgi:ribonuclease Z